MMRLSLYVGCLGLLISCYCSAVIFDTVNDHIPNGDAEGGWTSWNHSANTSLAADSVVYGSQSFELRPTVSTHSDIRTNLIPADSEDVFILKYYFKSVAGSVLNPGTGFVFVRSYDKNDIFIGESVQMLEDTNDFWVHREFTIQTQPGSRNIDVRLIINGFGSNNSTGQFRFDNIELYRYLPSLSEKIGSAPTQVFVVRQNVLNNAQFIAIQTLQGLLAQNRPEIWIDQGDLSLLDDMVSYHGVTYTRIDSFYWYLNRYKSQLAGYILYDLNDKASITAANSMCGIRNAIAVDVSLESYIVSNFGLSKVFDARLKNDLWVYNNHGNEFDRDAIIVRTDDVSFHPAAYYFRDWGVALRSLFWWNGGVTQSRQVYNSIFGNAPIYGWTDGTSSDEIESISFHSESGLYQVPADWLLNLSTLAGMARRVQPWNFKQPISDRTYTKEQGVHYVAFMMSDMDNIQSLVAANNFRTNLTYYANANRGNFAMGWGMPPSLVELAPTAVELWYRGATMNDGFCAPTSGMGYTYPSLWPANELQANMIKLKCLMEKADLETVVIGDKLWPKALTASTYGAVAEKFASLEQVKGMFYLDVNGDYARYGREADAGRAQRIYWFNGKPFVPCRYTLWNGSQYNGISKTGLQLAQSINALPTDPQNPNSYTFVVVHAWSYGLNEIAACIANLNSNVRVVTPDEFIKQIRMNFLPCDDNPPKADTNGDCRVDLDDLREVAVEWLSQTPQKADFNNDGKINFNDFSILASEYTVDQ